MRYSTYSKLYTPLIQQVDVSKKEAYSLVDKNNRAKLGQYFTPTTVARFMSNMISLKKENVRILDPGSGVGILAISLVEKILEQKSVELTSIHVSVYEIEKKFIPILRSNLELCTRVCQSHDIKFSFEIHNTDFIVDISQKATARNFVYSNTFDIAILNPPYKKINVRSKHRQELERAGLTTTNLYTGFMWLSLLILRPGGELIAITPRSYCNGTYFKSFRKQLFSLATVKSLHVYNKRNNIFTGDDVLQENIILHAVKDAIPAQIKISSSNDASHSDLLTSVVEYHEVVNLDQDDPIIHVTENAHQKQVREVLNLLSSQLFDLGISVSTGKVVDFRAKHLLRSANDDEAVPLIYPIHFDRSHIKWPVAEFDKPQAMTAKSQEAKKQLVPTGHYVLVKRFSAKEEKRRITAALFDANEFEYGSVGFENHLNFYHANKQGMEYTLAKGLTLYLNSSAVDCYFRQFSGSTQVNVGDLKKFRYPSRKQLMEIGHMVECIDLSQEEVDEIINSYIGLEQYVQ